MHQSNNFNMFQFQNGAIIRFPEKLLNVPDAMMAALYFWRSRKLNDLADMDDCRAITRRINGGLNGYDHRLQILNYLKVSLQ